MTLLGFRLDFQRAYLGFNFVQLARVEVHFILSGRLGYPSHTCECACFDLQQALALLSSWLSLASLKDL